MKDKLMAFVERIRKPVSTLNYFVLCLLVALSLVYQLWGNETTAQKLAQSTIFFLVIAIFTDVKHVKERLEKLSTKQEVK